MRVRFRVGSVLALMSFLLETLSSFSLRNSMCFSGLKNNNGSGPLTITVYETEMLKFA
jgi:hypothetical protein